MGLEKKLDDFIASTEEKFQKVDERFESLTTEVRGQFESLKAEVRARGDKLENLTTEVRGQFESLKADMHRQGILFENMTSEVKAYAEAVRKQTRRDSVNKEYNKKLKKVDTRLEILETGFKAHAQDKKIHLSRD